MIPGSATPFLLTKSGDDGYKIDRSLRFNSGDSAYLNRTPSSAGNRKTWTWSGWVKRSTSSASAKNVLFEAAGNGFMLGFDDGTADVLRIEDNFYTGGLAAKTTAVFRDFSAWYHIVLALDTTQASSSDGIKIWVNNVLQTLTSVNYTQNYETLINSTIDHYIGGNATWSGRYFNGYLADIHFIDGQAAASTDFGEYDDNNVWQPKKYSGSYGTNGFYLKFADNSSNAALGTDSSGNSNTLTVNNLSVASGAGNDSLIDTPTNYDAGSGNPGGNYATLNPLQNATGDTFSDGNLKVATSSSYYGSHTSTIATPLSGKWFAEIQVASSTVYSSVGLVASNSTFTTTSWPGSLNYDFGGVSYYGNNGKRYLETNNADYGATFGNGDIIGIAYDADNGTVAFYKNGVSQGTISSVPLRNYYFAGSNFDSGSATYIWNFGQRAWAYAPPSGYKALCTTNLPDPTIVDGSTAFDAKLFTGNHPTGQSITSLNFSPDFVWLKDRASTNWHYLFDAIRGTEKGIFSNSTNAEGTYANTLTAFNSDGFTLGSDNATNQNGNAYVAWAWDAGSSTASNTDGSMTSSVRANPSAGFSIATYTGAEGGTFGHGLNAAPEFVMVKRLNSAASWCLWHKAIANTQYLMLDSTAGVNSWNVWGNTSPTSTVVSVSGDSYTGNLNDNYVAYCFASVEGYSAFGSYTGNGSADGPFLYTGFKPRWVMIKATSFSEHWYIYDTKRNVFNVNQDPLLANSSNGGLPNEGIDDSGQAIDILSNGFKIRGAWLTNNSSQNYVYAAFAEQPINIARAR